MSDVAVVSRLPIQSRDCVSEDPMGELQDRLVPVLEDELPQGVLELLAPLMMRHRPLTDIGRGQFLPAMLPAVVAAEFDAAQKSPTPVAVSYPHPQLPSNRPVAYVVPAATSENLPFFKIAEAPPSEHSVIRVEAALPEPVTHPDASEIDGQRPEASSSIRHRPSLAPAPAPAIPPSRPIPEAIIDTLPNTERSLLQVPFNKGIASGQVTISRVADEPTRTLQLSPSNALVFEQLKVSLEQVREPAWRLTDSGGEQQRQGSRQAPDDEQSEDAGHEA